MVDGHMYKFRLLVNYGYLRCVTIFLKIFKYGRKDGMDNTGFTASACYKKISEYITLIIIIVVCWDNIAYLN